MSEESVDYSGSPTSEFSESCKQKVWMDSMDEYMSTGEQLRMPENETRISGSTAQFVKCPE